jgi:trans-aconitate 2-methyltransferase
MQQTPFRRYFEGYDSPWEYSDAEIAAVRLRRAGFEQVETNLEETPTQLPNAHAFQQFVGSVILHRHLERLPGPELRGEFLAELTRQAASDGPAFLLDYWRLNLPARRRN